MPPPTFDKQLLKDIRRNKHLMNPEFLTRVEHFAELLKSRMGPKRSCYEGEFVTGEGTGTYRRLKICSRAQV